MKITNKLKDLMANKKDKPTKARSDEKITESGTSPQDPSVPADPKEPTTQQAQAKTDNGLGDADKDQRDAIAKADGNTNAAGAELTGDETPDEKIRGGVNVGEDPLVYRKGETTRTVVRDDGVQEVVVEPAENPEPYEGKDTVSQDEEDDDPVTVEAPLTHEKADYKAGYTSETVLKEKDGKRVYEVKRVKVENYESPSKGDSQAEALAKTDDNGTVTDLKETTEANCTHPAWVTQREVSRKENKDGTVTTKFEKKCQNCGKEVVTDDAGNYNP